MRHALLSTTCMLAVCAQARAAPVTPISEEELEEREELQPVEESPRDLHWGFAFAEAGVLVGILEAFYWSDKEANSFDFQYNADTRNLKARFWTFEAWSLDDNYFNTNAWRHTAQGGLNYLFARSNGFSSIQSYVFSLAMSAAWEFFGEYKEEVSINDLIVTPRSGAIVAESVWQLGVFFLRGEQNWFNRIAGNALTLGREGLDSWRGKTTFHSPRTNSLGFDTDLKHRFSVSLLGGARTEAGESRGIFRIGVDTELILIPGFDRPGRQRELRTAPSFTQIHVEGTQDDQELIDFRAFARAAVTAWHRKRIKRNRDGWNLIYGLSSAYEYGHHESKGYSTLRTRDRVAIAHLLGPTLDLTVQRAGFRARGVVDIYANFGLLRSHAMDAHLDEVPDEEVRSTITRDGYYHALGLTGRLRLEASYSGVAAGVDYQRDHFKSVQGIDRHQEDLVDDYPLYDERAEGRVWARYGFAIHPDLGLEIQLAAEFRDRSGRVKSTETESREYRYLGGFQFAF